MKFFGKRKWLIGVGGLVVMATTLLCWPFGFCYDSVCTQCGEIKDTREWQLPMSKVTFFTHSSFEQTPLSTYLTTSGIVGVHSHQWLFGHGCGSSIRCALGAGDALRGTVTSPEVVRFLALSRQFRDPQENSNLLCFTFDQDLSRAVLEIAHMVPTNGFTTREQYQEWFNAYDFVIKDAIERSTRNR